MDNEIGILGILDEPAVGHGVTREDQLQAFVVDSKTDWPITGVNGRERAYRDALVLVFIRDISEATLRMEPVPRSKISFSPLPNSNRKQALAWAMRWSGMPVPQAMTLTSPFASISVPG